ncbi:MAG: aldehyde-activating protein [Chitinivibrionales bacterium]|nr:aldehyde-activating protein [Chitinivibrionales bacterium]
MNELSGGCLCGAVTYACASQPLATAVCHCKACQKSSGTAFSVVVAVARDALRITGNSLKAYEDTGDSGNPTVRHFCSRCGTTIFGEMAARPGIAFVKAGTLDDGSRLQPRMHVYWRDHMRWIERIGDLPKHDTMPDR